MHIFTMVSIFSQTHTILSKFSSKMTSQKCLELKIGDVFKEDKTIWKILCKGGIRGFIDTWQGSNESLSHQIANSWDERRVIVDGTHFVINTKLMMDAIGMRNAGPKHSREMRATKEHIQKFIRLREEIPKKMKSKNKTDFIAHPYDKVAKVIIKLITMKGRYMKIYNYHFILLSHFRGRFEVNISHFLFHCLNIYIRRN